MKRVFAYIAQRSAAFKDEPLFVYLRDPSIDPRARLEFVPCAAHFVMTFADLYHFFLTEDPPRDRFQQLVNTHLSEEGSHWKWFLADLTNLELDPKLRFTDALRFIWSDRMIKTRKLAYEMCKLSAGLSSLHKLVMVQSIEATGRVALEAAVPAGAEAAKLLGRKLVYFGNHHLETEREHTLEEDAVQKSLEDVVVVDEAKLAELLAIVDQVFEHFRGFIDEAYRFAQNGHTVLETIEAARVSHAS